MEACSILKEHSLKRLLEGAATHWSHNDNSPLLQRRQIRNALHQARLVRDG